MPHAPQQDRHSDNAHHALQHHLGAEQDDEIRRSVARVPRRVMFADKAHQIGNKRLHAGAQKTHRHGGVGRANVSCKPSAERPVPAMESETTVATRTRHRTTWTVVKIRAVSCSRRDRFSWSKGARCQSQPPLPKRPSTATPPASATAVRAGSILVPTAASWDFVFFATSMSAFRARLHTGRAAVPPLYGSAPPLVGAAAAHTSAAAVRFLIT